MGRFSLKSILGRAGRVATGEMSLVTEPDATWLGWADSHGFKYQLDGSDLVGRYFERPPDRPGTEEQYYGIVRGTWNDRPFTYFQRKTLGGATREPGPQFMAALVLQLPGAPRADLLAMGPPKAFESAGGKLPNTGSFQWHPPDLLLGRGHWFDPPQIEGILENITLQLAIAPAELWQP
jgi:hypothetical protein